MAKTRILMAFEARYRCYQDAIARAIREHRPYIEVVTAELEALEEQVERLDPHLVICSQPSPANQDGRLAWVELSQDPDRPSKICIGGWRWELLNPSLEELLEVVDETEKLVRANQGSGTC